jgi:hypothetical protein
MQGSAVYGVFMGLTFGVLTRAAPQPAGSIVFWGFVAAQLAWGAAICWRRTGLPFATASMATGAALSAWFAVLAATGRVFPDLPRSMWVPAGIGFLLGPLFFLIESRVNRDKWTQWTHYMERKSAWEIFTGRHIPQLRDDNGPPNERDTS